MCRAFVCQLLLFAGCSAAPDSAAVAGAPGWQRAQATLDAQGLTQALRFELPPGTRALALRAYAEDESARCYALQDVVVNEDTTWVGAPTTSDYGDYCQQCAQRVAAGSGYVLGILPSAADDAPPLTSLSARVGLRDCVTLTPARDAPPGTLRLELSAWQPPAADARLRLPLAVVLATQVGFASDARLLPAALGALQEIWAQAGIQLVLETPVEIAPEAAAVEYSATDQSALIALWRRAREALGARDARWPVLLFGPCLRRHELLGGGQSEPWAFTPHLPGGSGVGELPDQIFVAAERCEGLAPAPRWDDAAQLGAVLAHELGHYLGLYHVVEADGRQDALSDTGAGDPNLMRATPSATATVLSPSQIGVARRHDAFARTPDLQP